MHDKHSIHGQASKTHSTIQKPSLHVFGYFQNIKKKKKNKKKILSGATLKALPGSNNLIDFR